MAKFRARFKHHIAVLPKAHLLAKALNPCDDTRVRELLGRTRRAYAKRGARPHKERALTEDPLQAVLATCDDTLRAGAKSNWRRADTQSPLLTPEVRRRNSAP